MKLFLVTAKRKPVFKAGAIETEFVAPRNAASVKAAPDDIVYIEAAPALKKTAAPFKRKNIVWAVFDPAGRADPAECFFLGASDYIGPKQAKKALDKKRLAAALAFHAARSEAGSGPQKAAAARAASLWVNGNTAKLLPGAFKGWQHIQSGETQAFFFLFVGLKGETNLRSRLGEKSYTVLRGRLKNYLQQLFQGPDSLPWMESDTNNLLLVPSKIANIQAAVSACFSLLLNAPLVNYEALGIVSFPVEFTLALHYGKTEFKAPGKTGTVVSDAVNFIFHLGCKRAEPGRLTVSDAVPEEALPEGMRDLFVPAGEYEGRTLIHSRRFVRG
jgi:hypothetical protein